MLVGNTISRMQNYQADTACSQTLHFAQVTKSLHCEMQNSGQITFTRKKKTTKQQKTVLKCSLKGKKATNPKMKAPAS